MSWARLSACMLIFHKGHNNNIQVYSMTVLTHVKALQAGQSSQGTVEPILQAGQSSQGTVEPITPAFIMSTNVNAHWETRRHTSMLLYCCLRSPVRSDFMTLYSGEGDTGIGPNRMDIFSLAKSTNIVCDILSTVI